MHLNYVVNVRDVDARQQEISMRAEEAIRARSVRKEYKFRGGAELPVISLPIDYLIYRLENYRTGDKQLSLVATGKVPSGFFAPSRREDPSVQQKQHEILVQHARTGSGETIKPIYDELARVAEQTDDLIISADGVVVNGNRRLSAMRELLRADPQSFGKFANVICAVLPASTTLAEILKLEIGLQMQPETKLPYEWTALGRAVRDLRDQGMTDADIAGVMNRDRSDIVRAAKMIDSADMYLTDWMNSPNDFDLLEDTEQAFKQIATRNSGKADVAIRELTRQFDFFIIEGRAHLEDRAYVLVNAIEDNPTLFLDTVAAEFDVDLANAAVALGGQHKISFDEGPVEQAKDYSPLIEKLAEFRKTETSAKAAVKAVEAVCRIVAEQGRQRDAAAVRFARNAEKALLAIDLQSGNPSTYAEIDTILAKCVELSERLRAELAQRQSR